MTAVSQRNGPSLMMIFKSPYDPYDTGSSKHGFF